MPKVLMESKQIVHQWIIEGADRGTNRLSGWDREVRQHMPLVDVGRDWCSVSRGAHVIGIVCRVVHRWCAGDGAHAA
jgi:hypothetical protein